MIHSRFSEEGKDFSKIGYNEKTHQKEQTIIISTNICETSLTIPSLGYVVDTCLTRYVKNN